MSDTNDVPEPKVSLVSKDGDSTTTSTKVGSGKSKKRKNRWGVKPADADKVAVPDVGIVIPDIVNSSIIAKPSTDAKAIFPSSSLYKNFVPQQSSANFHPQYNEYGGIKTTGAQSRGNASSVIAEMIESRKQKLDELAIDHWSPDEIVTLETERLKKLGGGTNIKVVVDRSHVNTVRYICELCSQHTYNQATIEHHLKSEQHLKKKSMDDSMKSIRKSSDSDGKLLPGENSYPLDFSGEPQPPGVVDFSLSDYGYGEERPPTTEMTYVINDDEDYTMNIDEAIEEDPEDSSLSFDPRKIKIINQKSVTNVFVGDLPGTVKPSYVKYLFSRCGGVTSVHMLQEQNRGFVNYNTADACSRAIQQLNGLELDGSLIWVDFPDKGEESLSKEEVISQGLIPLRVEKLSPLIPKIVVRMLFGKYGEVKGMKQSKFNWSAFVYMADVMSASRAVTCMSGLKICGDEIEVKFFISKHFKESTEIGSKLWVGGISAELTNNVVRKLFIDYGLVQMNRLTAKKCAFLSFNTDENAARAMSELNGLEMMGSYLLIKYPVKGKFNKDDKDAPEQMDPAQTNQQPAWENWGGYNGAYGAPEGWADGPGAAWPYDAYGNWGNNSNYWGGGGGGQFPPHSQPHWMNQGQGRGNFRGPQGGPPHPGPGRGGPPNRDIDLTEGPMGEVLMQLSKGKVNNEEDSFLAMSVVDYLTHTLKQYKSSTGDTDVTTFLGVAEQKLNAIKDIKAHLNKSKMRKQQQPMGGGNMGPNPRFEPRDSPYSKHNSNNYGPYHFDNWDDDRNHGMNRQSDKYSYHEEEEEEPPQSMWADY